MAAQCFTCGKSAAEGWLRRCSQCKEITYCNRRCQRADWKTHKNLCVLLSNANVTKANSTRSNSHSAPVLKDLEHHVLNPFTRLDQGTYLHDRPKLDVYKLLIDSFRMRQQDDMQFELKITPKSVYSGAASSIKPFRKYLAQAATRSGLLPPWWTPERQRECEEFGESGAWNNLRRKVTKAEVIAHYGGKLVPMQLRMLAEAIIGVGSMGQNGTGMRKMMCEVESNGIGEGVAAMMLSMNLGFHGGH